jgi:4-diphosphocytidyl-2-C-methyl-D-erythritol kinase
VDREAGAVSRMLRVSAPAKINWTVEVLRIRSDGYHEIRSVLQTIDLCDVVTLADADDVTLSVIGEAGPLAGEPVETNFAYRAAMAFRRRTRARRGARIVLEKRVPVAAGLGGGSSDAAAVLRGLNELWGAGQPLDNLVEIAGEIGSDPPFFVVGGTAMASGRGDVVAALPDAVAPSIVLAMPPPEQRGDKTASMYGALTPADYSDGYVSIGAREIVEAGRPIVDEDLANVFERVTAEQQPATALAMDALKAQGHTPHLAGSGPSFYLLEPPSNGLLVRIRDLGFEPRAVATLPRDAALRIAEL